MVSEALERLSLAGQGFGELITSHLRLVAFMQPASDFALPYLQIYVLPLTADAKRSSHLMACQLVWAATVVRLCRDRLHFGHAIMDESINQAARNAQLRFLKQFRGWEVWAKALHLDNGQNGYGEGLPHFD